MKTNLLRGFWMMGLVLALACGGSGGGDNPPGDTTQPPGDSTTPPEDMTIPPVECDEDTPCADGEYCGPDGVCEVFPEDCNPACAEDEICNLLTTTCEKVEPSECDPPCEAGEECLAGMCWPAECDPPCTDNENCEDGTCVLDPTMVGSVPTSCGSPDQNLEPVDCTENGDTNAQCVFSNHCMCTAADGFKCEDNGEDDSSECVPGSSCVTATLPGNKPLSEIFETIFQNQGCTAGYCHGGGANELLLSDVANTHANLVGQTATTAGCGLTERVVPGNPEESILWHRVKPLAEGETADTACISKMPAGSDGLSEEHAQLIYDWIKGGALQ